MLRRVSMSVLVLALAACASAPAPSARPKRVSLEATEPAPGILPTDLIADGTKKILVRLNVSDRSSYPLGAYTFMLLEEHGHVPVLTELPDPTDVGVLEFDIEADWWAEVSAEKTYGEFRLYPFWLVVRPEEGTGIVIPLLSLLSPCFREGPLPDMLQGTLELGGPNQALHHDANSALTRAVRAGERRR